MKPEKFNPDDHIQEFKTKWRVLDPDSIPTVGINLTLKNPTEEELIYVAEIELVDDDDFHVKQKRLFPGENHSLGYLSNDQASHMRVAAGDTKLFRGSIEFSSSDVSQSTQKPVLHLNRVESGFAIA